MPSPRHDAINQLFRERPELAVEILRELMGADVPADLPVRVESNDFNDRPSKDFQPDTVIAVGPPQEPAHGIVVEIQQKKSAAKRRQLPRYAATLWLMLKCPVTVLCVCPDTEAATWFAEPIRTELPGFTFQAAVLGPTDVPVITSPEEAAVQPELAVMAVMAVMVHGTDRSMLEKFMSALDLFKPEHAPQYYEHAYNMAAPAVQRLLGDRRHPRPHPRLHRHPSARRLARPRRYRDLPHRPVRMTRSPAPVSRRRPCGPRAAG